MGHLGVKASECEYKIEKETENNALMGLMTII